jgi:hypothetical protein
MECSICGRELEPSWRFCQMCGAPVPTIVAAVAIGSEVGSNGPVGRVCDGQEALVVLPPAPVPVSMGARPEAPAYARPGAVERPDRATPRSGWTMAAWAMAAIGLVAALGLGFARQSVDGRLGAARVELVSLRDQLVAARSDLASSDGRAKELDRQLSGLQGTNDKLAADLREVKASKETINDQLTACHNAFRLIVDHPNPTRAQAARFNDLLFDCFRGMPPFA